MATKTARHAGRDLLGVYLNDHLAGATAGTELARRLAGAAQHVPASGSVLKQLAADIAEDRAALLEMMASLRTPVRRYKVYAAWAGEKAGRLKLNGHLLARSPLSGLEEAELLRLGVEGKGAGWRTLRMLAERDSRLDAGRLDELISRAAHQSSLLEELRVRIAGQVFRNGTSA
ncbi:MAG: hypothetical protein JOY82_14010 [Streptosporangiaceae bacterium]|nr:hypothetical protein [Streptosporangiaceae bacterium]